jgi:hypothetical protein
MLASRFACDEHRLLDPFGSKFRDSFSAEKFDVSEENV